jgi:hypothetical protein
MPHFHNSITVVDVHEFNTEEETRVLTAIWKNVKWINLLRPMQEKLKKGFEYYLLHQAIYQSTSLQVFPRTMFRPQCIGWELH